MGPAGSPESTAEKSNLLPLIRAFRPADFETVCLIDKGGSGSRYGSAVFVRQASVVFSPFFFVAELKDSVTGYAIGGLTAADPLEGWVLRLKVVEGARSRGIGRLLLDAVINNLTGAGANRILLSVAPGNRVAVGLYRRYGFSKIGFQAGYFGPGEDRFIMEFRSVPSVDPKTGCE